MNSAPQLVIEMPKLPAPKLLVEWSSPWDEFISSIRPALTRSRRPLAGEAHTGLFPYRGILISWILESALLVAAIVLPEKLASMHPYTPPPIAKYDVIYFSGDELPQTEDAGGAQAGRSGRAGGHEARHPTQTIRVARGESPTEKVVDAPKLNLPRSDSPVANLLAFKQLPGAAPTEGLKSNVASAALPQMTVVPPTPQVMRDQMPASPALATSIVAPPQELAGDKMRSAPKLDTGIVPPAPSSAQRELAGMRLPVVSSTNVVPPSVSAPERESTVNPKLLLPAPAVVAPPPSDVTRDVGSVASAGLAGDVTQVVPPPVNPGSTSLDSRVAGAVPGTQAVVPPPATSGTRSLASQIWSGLFGGKDTNVVPPPVQDTNQASARQMSSNLETTNGVVPPPAQSGPRSLNAPAGALLSSVNAVPPPPNVGGGSSPERRGLGAKGGGSGGPLDLGSAVAPPNSGGGGSGAGKGLVVSNQPGSKVGIPGNAGGGTLAMSPTGTDKTGLGGSGGGTGIGRGNGPGSGFSGSGPGAGKEGLGKGSDPAARGGISPYPGTGGSGRGTDRSPLVPGVAVAGGSTINLPNFSVDANDPNLPGRSSGLKQRHGPNITVVGSSRSGGAFNFYGTLKGDNYTIYIPTTTGTVVMQFADPSSAGRSYAGDLTAPDPIRADLPAGLQKSRLVIACVLDRSGQLRNVHVLERGAEEMTSKILAALPGWKFRPAVRNEQPVEVDAILGFNIDTR
jgi:hypothetical protein